MGRLTALLFTHPTCVGCGEALRRLEAFTGDHPDVEMQIVSLAAQSGQTLARVYRVRTVPTILFRGNPGQRVIGVPKIGELESLYQQAVQVQASG
jgi:glutaredoxin